MKKNRKTTESSGNSTSNSKHSIWKTLIIVMIFIVGLGIFSYPIITNIIYEKAAKRVNQDFDTAVTKIEDNVVKDKMDSAHAYNDYLSGINNSEVLKDPYTKEQMDSGVEDYAKMLEINEQIGHIVIPKINLNAPIYVGTSEKVLQKGIGHMEGTSLPVGGNYTHTVLTGHRGLPTAKLFTDLDKLEVGDKFYIKNIGGTIAYEVDQIKVVEPTELSDLAIVPGHDYCTLLTCTPYMINSHRLLVRGHRIDYVEAVMEKEITDSKTNNMYRNLFWGTLTAFIALLMYILLKFLKTKRKVKAQSGIDVAFSNEKRG
ncbi:class C sortase [Clostridium zeae]|uniref:Class C sortase n=1 Tax=Clostridium zeae TaxID=2759022 RepID=A0ABQ1EHT4_9CLOT|nr:class C sortase [Clostridium zeae]GFZ34310.1 class C sortase [Clostridium zeae]